MLQYLVEWLVIIGSGNGFVPSGTKPLPEPVLTLVLWYNMASIGHNELTHKEFFSWQPNQRFPKSWLKMIEVL